jgi:hypothetical protein
MHKQVQRNKLSHDHPHKCTSPQHYPNINMGMVTPHNSQDVAEQADEEEVPEVDEHAVNAVEDQPRFPYLPCHTLEETSLSHMSQEANNNLHSQKIIRSTSTTRTFATRAVSTSKIGTRAQLAPKRNKVTRTASHMQTTCSTNKRGTHFAKMRCTRRCTRQPNGVGQ